ncbi:MAG: transcription antitermination factor NusB [Firmicutes bacterium]|nr:transcription antitermination factor NusB [Bacillota bacterium]
MEDTNKTVNTRVKAREFAFELIFARTFSKDEPADSFWAHEIENSEAEFGEQIDYIRKVFFGVDENQELLDEKIASAAVGWSLSRLSKTSLSIMRLCVYEMMNIGDVPKRVALNEAVELAKKFDDDKASGFINGVLNTIARSLPDRECDK